MSKWWEWNLERGRNHVIEIAESRELALAMKARTGAKVQREQILLWGLEIWRSLGTVSWETVRMSQIRKKGHQRRGGCVRAAEEPKREGLGWAGVEEGRTGWGGCLGGWCRLPCRNAGGRAESRQGCRRRLLEGDRGCAQFGSAEPEGPGEGLSEMAGAQEVDLAW